MHNNKLLAVKMKSFRDQLLEIKNSLKSCEKKSLVSEKKDSKRESSANEVKYKICPVCGCKLRFNNFRKHMALQHDIKVDSTVVIESKSTAKVDNSEIVKCPVCSAKVKKHNLKRHARKVHLSPKVKKKVIGNSPRSKRNSTTPRRIATNRHTSPEHRQAMLAKINQGQYDNERQLLNLLKNASDREEEKIVNAVHQRLKLIAPETYRKLVGPLHIRDPLGIKKCYCGNPRSLSQIADDIISDIVPEYSLLCDACWEEDICSAWGHYGAWGAKIIDTETWRTICEERGDTKYATY